jgi:dTDP-4-amino-4,6-dideoxygalactose transaminase
MPVAERLSATVMSIPVHPEVTAAERDIIVAAVNAL